MEEVVTEIFERFLSIFQNDSNGTLHVGSIQSAEEKSRTKALHHTVLIEGKLNESIEPLAIVLVTSPSHSPEDQSILEFIARRARAYKAPYFVTWTLRHTILWRTPKPGIPFTRDSIEKLRDYPDIYEIGANDQQIITEQNKITLLKRGQEIFYDLDRLLKDEALELVQIDATYFVGRLIEAVNSLLPIVSSSIQHRLENDVGFRNIISDWAVTQSIAGTYSDPEFAKSISRLVIYRLLGKVLFYQSLRRSARHLPKLEFDDTDSAQVLPTLRAAFTQALKIDYHAVFEETEPDRIQWPAKASTELAKLITDFNTRDFANLPQDVVGNVFERLIPPEERHGLGQYFTNENLCDLIAAFCIQSKEDKVLDPTCGTGTFLIRAYDRMRWLGQRDHAKMLSQLWGVDIAPFPAELAVINLFRQRVNEHGNFPRVVCQDFLKVSPGDKFPFPPPKVDIENPESIEEPIPEFDSIIGNFPYVSASQIEKHEAGYLRFLRELLINEWLRDFPTLFYFKSKQKQADFEKLISMNKHVSCDSSSLEHRISTYADLYIHLFFHTSRFLKMGGRMGIITSNAWLDVNYGYAVQDFFLRHFKIVAILESRCEPWFVEASVNTVVTILEKCNSREERDNSLVRFVKVKRTLTELFPGDPIINAVTRWKLLTNIVKHIEHAGIKYSKTFPLGCITEENDDFRIRILRQSEMHEEVKCEKKTVKWGKYLRAPNVYLDMIKNGNFCLLKEIGSPKRGGTTRNNDFFHITNEKIEEFKLEEEYLLPLIKSPKDTDKITIDINELNLSIFVCLKSKAELRKLGHHGSLKYIAWGEKQTYSKGEFKGLTWPEGTWLKKRKPGWWALPSTETNVGQIFFSQAMSETHLHRYSSVQLIPDARLYYLNPEKDVSSEILSAILNSSLCALSAELAGRVTMGDGVLELKVEDARDYLLVPDLRNIPDAKMNSIITMFKEISKRKIGNVFDEVKRKDRQVLDTAVLNAIGLDPKVYLKPLYEGLCELVRERIELGRSRGKERKTKTRADRAEKRTAEDVLDEILPQGPRRFPDDFFSTEAEAGSKTEVGLPEQSIIFDDNPMFKRIHTKDNSFEQQVRTPAEGKILVFAQKAGHKVAQLPVKMVELTRTVHNYNKYLHELRKQLYEAYYRRTLDTRIAARLTQAAFDRFKLPNPEG